MSCLRTHQQTQFGQDLNRKPFGYWKTRSTSWLIATQSCSGFLLSVFLTYASMLTSVLTVDAKTKHRCLMWRIRPVILILVSYILRHLWDFSDSFETLMWTTISVLPTVANIAPHEYYELISCGAAHTGPAIVSWLTRKQQNNSSLFYFKVSALNSEKK